MAAILCPGPELAAEERVVILAPAAADVLERLGAEDCVVGVTNSVQGFPAAVRVGTHLHPGVESIASLRPSLIIAGPWFDPELAGRMGAELFRYEPQTLDEIIQNLRLLSGRLHKEERGRILADQFQAVLDDLIPPEYRPSVLYETRSAPLSIAGTGIIKDLLERAGMSYAYPESAGMLSVEYLLANQPEYYLYQEGPMNKNPVPPAQRPGWEGFRACVWKVDEFVFARPNTELFETARLLNNILFSGQTCAGGEAAFRGDGEGFARP